MPGDSTYFQLCFPSVKILKAFTVSRFPWQWQEAVHVYHISAGPRSCLDTPGLEGGTQATLSTLSPRHCSSLPTTDLPTALPHLSPFQANSINVLVAQSCPTLCAHALQPVRLLCPWDSPGKNTGVGIHSLLQGTFSTQGSNPGLRHCRQILYHLSHQGNPFR